MRRTLARAALAGVLVVAFATVAAPASGKAGTLSISGYVYDDRNGNGVRDQGEPGVPGIRVRHGSGSVTTTTGADGGYSLTSLPASGNVTIETGWLRTQCPASGSPTIITCPAGPGADNDFTVANQFLRYPLTGATSATNIDAGLEPGWPGGSLTPPPVRVDDPVDVAARLSWASGTCQGGTLNICRAGDTFILSGQVYNQGTGPLTGITTKLAVPAGDCLTGLSLDTTATAPGITAMTTTPAQFDCGTRLVTATFTGALVPAGAIVVAINGTTATGPGTPGCAIASPNTSICSTAEPQGRAWLLAVSGIDQTGDPDSTFCAAGDPTICPTGVHDKRRAPDEVDPVGHNVDPALGTTTRYDLRAGYQILSAPSPVTAGATVTVRVWADNHIGDGNAAPVNPGATIAVHFPSGTTVTPPPAHALFSCAITITTSDVTTKCTYKGPISPDSTAPALDLAVKVPSGWVAGTTFRSVACAAPAASQSTADETSPAAAGCALSTAAASTPTDNDADISLMVS